jgi:hypothetical protein
LAVTSLSRVHAATPTPTALDVCAGAETALIAAGSGRGTVFEEPDQVADRVVAVPRVAKRKLVVHFVMVPASVTGLGQVAGLLEVIDDLGRRSFGDADGDGDVSEASGRVRGDAFEDVRVVGDEPPKMVCLSRT